MKRSARPARALCAATLLCLISLPQATQAQSFCRYNRTQTSWLLSDWTMAAAHGKHCGFPDEAVRNDGIKAFAVVCTRFWMPKERISALMDLEPGDVIFKLHEQRVAEQQPSKSQCAKALKDLRFYDKTVRAEVERLRKQEEAAHKQAEKNRIPDRILPPD